MAIHGTTEPMPTKFTVLHNDITTLPSDLLLLKHAMGFHGGDLVVANRLTASKICSEDEISPSPDEFAIVDTRKVIAPARVMFLGTPHLRDFSYGQMRHFAARAIEIVAREQRSLRLFTSTIHGVGYGLDASESLQSLVRGFNEGLTLHPDCRIISRISTAEFVVAELTGARGNVYLEVGFAWGRNIPVVTLAREGEKLHFDVSTHRCIFYRTIGQLAKELEKLVRGVYKCDDRQSLS